MSSRSDTILHYWVFQAAIVIVGVGWVCVEILAGNAVAGVVSFLLILANSIFALRAVSVRGQGQLHPRERLLVTLIANLLSIFSMAGILINFTALFRPSAHTASDAVGRVVYGGLFTSGLIFILASHWQSPLYLRALIAVSLILVTASLAIGLSGRLRAHEYNLSVE